MSIGSLEIVLCLLVGAAALGLYCLLMVLGRDATRTIRKDGLAVLGLPVLCIIAAAVTPPDTISMLILAVPLCVLYGAAVAVWLLLRYRRHADSGAAEEMTARDRNP